MNDGGLDDSKSILLLGFIADAIKRGQFSPLPFLQCFPEVMFAGNCYLSSTYLFFIYLHPLQNTTAATANSEEGRLSFRTLNNVGMNLMLIIM